MLAARHLLRQWDAGLPVWSWRLGAEEHLLHHMAFEILRWFLTRPRDLHILASFVAGAEVPAQFGLLMDRLDPALRHTQPYTATQLALALSLARTLFRNEPIPVRQCIHVRWLWWRREPVLTASAMLKSRQHPRDDKSQC
jgi:hypothetical protein